MCDVVISCPYCCTAREFVRPPGSRPAGRERQPVRLEQPLRYLDRWRFLRCRIPGRKVPRNSCSQILQAARPCYQPVLAQGHWHSGRGARGSLLVRVVLGEVGQRAWHATRPRARASAACGCLGWDRSHDRHSPLLPAALTMQLRQAIHCGRLPTMGASAADLWYPLRRFFRRMPVAPVGGWRRSMRAAAHPVLPGYTQLGAGRVLDPARSRGRTADRVRPRARCTPAEDLARVGRTRPAAGLRPVAGPLRFPGGQANL
jgi:hypothetical protein